MRYSSLPQKSLSLLLGVFSFVAFATHNTTAQDNMKNNGDQAAVKLNTAPPAANVQTYKVSPDGSFVVYQIPIVYTVETDWGSEELSRNVLYIVPAAGGTPKLVSTNVDEDESVSDDFQITSDSKYVVYRYSQSTGRNEVFSVPVSTKSNSRTYTVGKPIDLNVPNCPDCSVEQNFKISPNGKFVVYQAEDGNSDDQLFIAPVTGGKVVSVADGLPDGEYGGDVDDRIWNVSPDSRNVVFIYEYDLKVGTKQCQNYETGESYTCPDVRLKKGWYSIPTGSTKKAVFLTSVLQYGDRYKITSDSGYLIHVDKLVNDDSTESAVSGESLYSVPVTGGAARVRLSLANENVDSFRLFDSGSAAVYKVDRYNTETEENEYDEISTFTGVTADGRYRYSLETGFNIGSTEWAVAPLNRGIVFIGRSDAEITYDPGYGSDPQTAIVTEQRLYSLTVEGGNVPREIGLQSTADARLTYGRFHDPYRADEAPTAADVQFTSDGKTVVFKARREFGYYDSAREQQHRLYAVPIVGGPLPIELNPAAGDRADAVDSFRITPDNRRVVFEFVKKTGEIEVYPDYPEYNIPILQTDLYVNKITGGTAAAFASSPNSFELDARGTGAVFDRAVLIAGGDTPNDIYDDVYRFDLFTIALPR